MLKIIMAFSISLLSKCYRILLIPGEISEDVFWVTSCRDPRAGVGSRLCTHRSCVLDVAEMLAFALSSHRVSTAPVFSLEQQRMFRLPVMYNFPPAGNSLLT